MKTLYLLIALVGGTFVAGLGWYAYSHPKMDVATLGFQSSAYLPEQKTVSEDVQSARELQTILKNFQNAKSFRSHVSIKLPDQTTEGDIEVSKPARFHGSMDVSGQTLDVIGVEDILYVKNPDGIWIPVKSEQLATQLQQAFSIVSNGSTDEVNILPAGTTVSKQKSRSDVSCITYHAEYTDSDGNDTTMDICATDGFPVRIDLVRADGTIQSDYKDFNTVIVIERPTIPAVFRSVVE
ncbi:MAG: hypothetical protein NUV81_00705 [bacterium]|nr:hypothetical protein [bacterium]